MNVTILIAYLVALAVPMFALYIIRALDLFNSTKMSTLVICVLWGAFPAFGLAYMLNNATYSLLLQTGLGDIDTVRRLTAPILEELLKGLFLVYLIRQPSFRYFVDGAIYGFCIGIGFAVLENYFYISQSNSAALGLAISRVLSTSLMHAMASGIVGISLGRLRRASGREALLLPIAGIVLAILVHIGYNNVVNSLSGIVLLLVAIAIGMGGAGFIGLQIRQGLKDEKEKFEDSLTLSSDVSDGERMTIQRLGGSAEEIFDQIAKTMGDENANLIRKMLIAQANIGILNTNLSATNVSPRLREAWEEEIGTLQHEFQGIRKDLDRTVMTYMQTLFPTEDESMRSWLQTEMGATDPTRVHTFDMFMRTSGLASSFTPEQLEAMGEKLQRIDIFKHVKAADLENLARAIEVKYFTPDALLFEQGKPGDAMYLIVEGGISIYSVDSVTQKRTLIRTFEPGRVVGDLAVLDGQPRSASGYASGALTALMLRRQMFQMFIQSRPQVILALLRVLAEKARFTTTSVENAIDSASKIANGNYAAVALKVNPVESVHNVPPLRKTPAVAPSLRRGAATISTAIPATPTLKNEIAFALYPTVQTAETPEAVSELSIGVSNSLNHAFARLATTLQEREKGSE